MGADVAIDKDRGPVFLELNARPGLSIQLANLSGLKRRLERVSDLKIGSLEKGVRVGMDLFGGEVEEELEEISGKKIIGAVEKVKLIGKDGKEIEVEAKIDTGAYSSSIDKKLAKEMGFADVLDFFEKIELPTDFAREKAQETMNNLKEKHKHPDLFDIDIIYSANGVSIRPKIKMSFIMDKLNVPASVNVTDRNELNYPVIIGRKNLGKFLIDTNKKSL